MPDQPKCEIQFVELKTRKIGIMIRKNFKQFMFEYRQARHQLKKQKAELFKKYAQKGVVNECVKET